jgi:hypothetical protein
MASVTANQAASPAQRVKISRLLWVGPLAIVAAVIVNQIIRLIAVSLLGIGPEFMPLSFGPPLFFSVIGVLGATIAFAIIARFAQRPIALFRTVALVVLLISFIPDVLVYTSQAMPGATLPAVATLMIMHVAAWAICVQLFSRLTTE